MSESSLDERADKRLHEKNEGYIPSGNAFDHLSKLAHATDGTFTAEDVEIISAHLDDHDIDECQKIIHNALKEHKGDVALEHTYYVHLLELVEGPAAGQSEEEWETIMKFEAFLIYDWSIYPAVRSVTRPIDEEEFENYENIRVYLISIIWSCAGSVLATFFAVRFPSISMNGVALQILIAYTGRVFKYIPDFSFPVGFGRRCHFGGGRWNFKEQMLATCGMGVGNQAPYSQNVIITMANDNFFGFKEAQSNFGFTILLTLATNLMGFGLAGIFRIFLVYPVRMVWYASLPGLRLSRVLTQPEERETVNGWRLKGGEFFWLFSFLEFGWFWITDFVFTFLGTFDWVAWIAHKSNDMVAVCSVASGVGINPFPSMDFSIFLPTGMIQPLFSTTSMLFGMLVSSLIIIGMWYMNISWVGYLPINTNTLYDRFGSTYNVSNVLDSKNNLDVEAYRDYSMPFWSSGALVSYGAFFAFYPAMIMFAILNYTSVLLFSFKIFGKTIINPKRALNSFDDRFTRSQRKYREVPEWWYIFFLCVCLGLGIAFVEHYKYSNTPVWTIFFGVGLSGVFMIPSGVLYATTNQQVIINVLYELVIGLTVEGNGTALMVSKAFATNFMVETDTFISNLKQAHYVGLAPRAMFRVQIINCICNSFVQSGLIVWQSGEGNIPGMCSLTDPRAKASKFTCQGMRTYFNAAVQWGTIGPRRILRDLYPRMRYSFLAGALFPIPFWLIRNFLNPIARKKNWGGVKEGGSRFRNSMFVRYFYSIEWINSFNELVMVSGAINWAPYNFMYYLPWLYLGIVFQWFLPKYYPRWWSKYNYLLYAAISVGYSYGALILFFSTEYHHIASINWWGNDASVSLSNEPRLVLASPDDYFGPRLGEWR